jgi:membrane associated rhomboid family serine protease
MLIIPLTGKIHKNNLPVVTISIILINFIIFFIFQAHDNERYEEAYKFYIESGLAKIEATVYSEYLKKNAGAEQKTVAEAVNADDQKDIDTLIAKMQTDEIFQKKLAGNEIITSNQEIFKEWRPIREKFDHLLSEVVSFQYGYKPAQMRPVTVLTHMFLHGSLSHIIGNMIFLWLVGCMLELGCGRAFYTVLYLLGGICAVSLFTLVYRTSNIPLIGASGAIAALMGAFTVMYGKTRIKVFYSLGFYFNYARISAILLLPIWIGNEIFQLLFGGDSAIAYVAHIGGLIGGGAIGFVNHRFLKRVDQKAFEEDPKEAIPGLLESALERIAKVDMKGARPLLQKILEIDPHNDTALMHLFNVDKLAPANKEFSETASVLLNHLSRDNKRHEELYRVYQEFSRLSKPTELDQEILFRIASVFNLSGRLRETENLLASFVKKHPNFSRLPTGILNLGRAYLKNGEKERGEKCLKLICQRFPSSSESRIAAQLLKSAG